MIFYSYAFGLELMSFVAQDVAATSLFVACKIEDTLKKSREILAASYNLRHPQAEPINSDNQVGRQLLRAKHEYTLIMEIVA